MHLRFLEKLYNPKILWGILLIITIICSLLLIKRGEREVDGKKYNYYNNYVIFKQSFSHLIENKDLYSYHFEEYHDLYKYSPSFALFMAPFVLLPDFIGLSVWNVINLLVLITAFYQLPYKSDKLKLIAVGFILNEAITSILNAQSNCLIAGLIIWAYIFMERKNIAMATLMIVLSIYIKIFGIVAFSLFLLYPNRIKAGLYTILWIVTIGLLPLFVIKFDQLIFLYQSWGHLLKNDHSVSEGLSVMGWLYTWFGWDVNKMAVLFLGAILFCIPLLRIKQYNSTNFRIIFLASVLIWVVIFNHKAESPTFIIAITGVSIWFFSQPYKIENLILLLFAFIFTEISSTDLFPRTLYYEWIKPYSIKALPCILIWLKLIFELSTKNYLGCKNVHNDISTPALEKKI